MTDDNEEIFRRAAEHYPLHTGNPDWEAVMKKMEANPAPVDTIHTPRKGKYRPLLLLLLILLLSIFVIEYFDDILNAVGNQKDDKKIVAAPSTRDASQNTGMESVQATPSINEPGKADLAGSTAGENKTAVSTISSQDQGTQISNAAQENITTNSVTAEQDDNGSAATQTTHGKKNETVSSTSPAGKRSGTHNKKSSASKPKTKMQVTNAAPDEDGNMGKNEKTKPAIAEIPKQESVTIISPVPEADSESSVEKNAAKQPVIDSSSATVNDVAKTTDTTAKKSSKKDDKKKSAAAKHFYAGLLGGIDYSTIKLQSSDKVGYSYGIIAGYRINKRFSIETGFLIDKKSYCSDGEYFSTKKLPMPSYVEIDYVTGDCHMYEVPLNVYYRFGKKERSAWFASTGISSYFMYKESYVFDVVHYGQTYPYDAVYKTKDNQFAAVINISGGYTHKIGKIGDLRIEPYFKLPVSKVGTGDLPIQSAGVNIGFTRLLF